MLNRRQALTAGIAAFATGCASWNKPKPKPAVNDERPKARLTDDGLPTAENLASFLDKQAKRIQLLDCQELDIETTAQGKRAPGMVGYLVCEKPRNFRLTGKVAGMSQVDFGSNMDQFWFWVRQAPEPHLFYCKYNDFDRGGVQLPFPFQPEWVLEGLGMGEYPESKRFQLEVKDRYYELTEKTTIQGQSYTKLTQINRFNAAPPVPQVPMRILMDSTGKVVCTAAIKTMQVDRRSGIPVPKKVVLDWPAEQLTMQLTLDRVTVNAKLGQDEMASLFSRPSWKDIRTVDLAATARPTSNVRQTGLRN